LDWTRWSIAHRNERCSPAPFQAQASLTLLAVVSDQTPRWVAERLVENALQDEPWNARLDELRQLAHDELRGGS
jgi:hypothetical protein